MVSKRASAACVGAIALASALVGCARKELRARGGGPSPRSYEMLESIPEVRCDRADACGEIGPGRRFADARACVESLRSGRRELGIDTCASGVDEDRMRDCVEALRHRDCHRIFEPIAEVGACRPSNVCRTIP
jgi:hypothetical protein